MVENGIILQRARIILHRKFLIPGHTEDRYSYSRTICLNAAVQVLKYQSKLHALHYSDEAVTANWRFFSLMSHDFLLAAMLLCLDIDYELQRRSMPNESLPQRGNQNSDFQERIELLQSSYEIWTNCFNYIPGVKQAADALAIVLRKIRMSGEASKQTGIVTNEISAAEPASGNAKNDPYIPVHLFGSNDTSSPSQISFQPPAIFQSTSNMLPLDDTIIPPGTDNFNLYEQRAMFERSVTQLDWMDWNSDFHSTMFGFN